MKIGGWILAEGLDTRMLASEILNTGDNGCMGRPDSKYASC